ncbi:hypothetical protein [Alloactinosynnema sp. L-07]|uniref:hypothetical protein n=1 Tax=Alloactinosynnema sp. L-07 TaxID=1653480 RepID=UPI0012F889B0|nr:hypothetical protein [Alloactinosynnema sp. L-07]
MRRELIPGGFGFPLGIVAEVAATMLVVAAGATAHPGLSTVAMVVVIDVMVFVTTTRATMGVAVVCWCLHAGFVLGRHGELAFTGQSGRDALLIALNTFGVLLLAATLRGQRRVPLHERENDPMAPRIPVQLARTAVRGSAVR